MPTPYVGVYADSYPEYVLSGTITPAPPSWTFNPDTRVLTLSHSSLDSSELEFSYQNAAYQQYSAGLSVDGAKHPAGEWKGRVKAATGRNPSAARTSDAIDAAATPGTPVTLTAVQADYWNNGMSRASGAYTIYPPGASLFWDVTGTYLDLVLARTGANSGGSLPFSTSVYQNGKLLQTIQLSTDGDTTTRLNLTGSGTKRVEVRLGHCERAYEQGNIQSQVFRSITAVGISKVAPVKKANLRFVIGDSNAAREASTTAWGTLVRAADMSKDTVINAIASRRAVVAFSSDQLQALLNEIDNAFSGRGGTLELVDALGGTNEAGAYYGSKDTSVSPTALASATHSLLVAARNRFPAATITVISATTGTTQEINETTLPPYRTALANEVASLGDPKVTYRSGKDVMGNPDYLLDGVHYDPDGMELYATNFLAGATLTGEIVHYTKYRQNTTENSNHQLVGANNFGEWGGNGGGDQKIPAGNIIGAVREYEEFSPPASGQGSFISGFALTTVTGPSGGGSLSTVVGGIYVDDVKIAAWTGSGGQAGAKTFAELGITGSFKPEIIITPDGYQITLDGANFYKIPGTPSGAHFAGDYLFSNVAIIPASALQATALADA